jgi:hypothetical protein
MTRQYRIEGIITTRWYRDRADATAAYNRSRACRALPSIHCPGDVSGDSFDGGLGYGTATAVHGVRDGHATVTLRMRDQRDPAAAVLGRRGGAVGSESQKAAARVNGTRGGRPRGPEHIPAPGRASGLRGEALCGRYARYATGDHDLIRRLAHESGDGFCADCLRRLAEYQERVFQAAHASTL